MARPVPPSPPLPLLEAGPLKKKNFCLFAASLTRPILLISQRRCKDIDYLERFPQRHLKNYRSKQGKSQKKLFFEWPGPQGLTRPPPPLEISGHRTFFFVKNKLQKSSFFLSFHIIKKKNTPPFEVQSPESEFGQTPDPTPCFIFD